MWTQSGSIAAVAVNSFGIPRALTAAPLGNIVSVVTIRGRSPVLRKKTVSFVSMCSWGTNSVLVTMKINFIPHSLYLTVQGAFSQETILGCSMGMTFQMTMKLGISHGIFSYESGLGNASTTGFVAKIDSSVKSGSISKRGAISIKGHEIDRYLHGHPMKQIREKIKRISKTFRVQNSE
jgi:Na+/alanine symporter